MRNSVRVPPRLLAKAAALVPRLAATAAAADVLGGEVTVQVVLRAALVRGLRAMEQEYAAEGSEGSAVANESSATGGEGPTEV